MVLGTCENFQVAKDDWILRVSNLFSDRLFTGSFCEKSDYTHTSLALSQSKRSTLSLDHLDIVVYDGSYGYIYTNELLDNWQINIDPGSCWGWKTSETIKHGWFSGSMFIYQRVDNWTAAKGLAQLAYSFVGVRALARKRILGHIGGFVWKVGTGRGLVFSFQVFMLFGCRCSFQRLASCWQIQHI